MELTNKTAITIFMVMLAIILYAILFRLGRGARGYAALCLREGYTGKAEYFEANFATCPAHRRILYYLTGSERWVMDWRPS